VAGVLRVFHEAHRHAALQQHLCQRLWWVNESVRIAQLCHGSTPSSIAARVCGAGGSSSLGDFAYILGAIPISPSAGLYATRSGRLQARQRGHQPLC
jgi:hypothetical protein